MTPQGPPDDPGAAPIQFLPSYCVEPFECRRLLYSRDSSSRSDETENSVPSSRVTTLVGSPVIFLASLLWSTHGFCTFARLDQKLQQQNTTAIP